MKLTVFLTIEEVIELHRKVIERWGGQPGIRDIGLISSALHRPQTGYYDGIFELAAVLLQSFAMNHPFLDGNKRVAFGVCDAFLFLNGYELNVSVDDVESFLIGRVIGERIDWPEISKWLKAHSTKIDSD